MTSPPKITAEWIVRAQLTICRPDNTNGRIIDRNQQDSNYSIERQPPIERHFDNENPIKVVYKWSSADANVGDANSVVETVLSAPNNASNVSSKDSGSFRSTGVTSSDSGIGTTAASVTNQIDKSICRSTCNIVLTACTNVIPEPNEMAESFPTTYYTLFPDNEPHSVQSNLSKQNILSMRDAFSQTSDIESHKYAAQDSYHSQENHKSSRSHSKHSNERNTIRGSLSSSNLATPPVFSPPSSSGTKPTAKKPSRTVHIDVYCTGSEAEDSSSSCSDSIDEPNIVELESNSTPQTVYDSNQLKLHHTRVIDTEDLPRRVVASNQHEYLRNASYGNLRDYLLAQCDSRDEVTESKQMLFEKHVGGINEERNQSFMKPRYTNAKNRFHLHREQSDDCISSNYPNSLHSTVRDLTCSSISSVMAPSSLAMPDDFESSWKETDMDNSTKGSSICPSDTFDYENRNDRWRIKQMEDVWKEKEKRWRMFSSSIMHDSIEEKEIIDDPVHDYSHVPDVVVEPVDVKEEVFNVNMRPSRPVFGRGKSMELPIQHMHERNARPASFWIKNDFDENTHRRKSPALIPGYTREHLIRAQKFGSVVESIRKPGHHVGPAKNPDCHCEYCRRWFAENGDHFRQRASSLDITFIGGSPSRRYTRNY